jgi:hypothetical protein
LYPQALETLERLHRLHQIVIITAKPGWATHDTFAWIADHGIPTREVHITRRKWDVDCDVYLDDAPHVLEDLVMARPEASICRFVRAWNHPMAGTVDIASWPEFEEFVGSRELRWAR